MNMLTKKSMLGVPDLMLTEIALGVDTPESVALRHGFSEYEFEMLVQQPSYAAALEKRTADLAAKGELFRVKARALADDLLESVYLDAKTEKADPKHRLDALKFLAQAGGVAAPPNTGPQVQGRQVQISIDLGKASGFADVRVQFADLFGPDNALSSDNELSSDIDGDYEEVDG